MIQAKIADLKVEIAPKEPEPGDSVYMLPNGKMTWTTSINETVNANDNKYIGKIVYSGDTDDGTYVTNTNAHNITGGWITVHPNTTTQSWGKYQVNHPNVYPGTWTWSETYCDPKEEKHVKQTLLLRDCLNFPYHSSYLSGIFTFVCEKFEGNYSNLQSHYHYQIVHGGLSSYCKLLQESPDNQYFKNYVDFPTEKNTILNIFKDWHPKLTCYLYNAVLNSTNRDSYQTTRFASLVGSKKQQKINGIIIDKTCNAAAQYLGLDTIDPSELKTRQDYRLAQAKTNKKYPNYMKDLLTVDLNELKF